MLQRPQGLEAEGFPLIVSTDELPKMVGPMDFHAFLLDKLTANRLAEVVYLSASRNGLHLNSLNNVFSAGHLFRTI
jgi:hypothetical protein